MLLQLNTSNVLGEIFARSALRVSLGQNSKNAKNETPINRDHLPALLPMLRMAFAEIAMHLVGAASGVEIAENSEQLAADPYCLDPSTGQPLHLALSFPDELLRNFNSSFPLLLKERLEHILAQNTLSYALADEEMHRCARSLMDALNASLFLPARVLPAWA